MPHSQQRHAYKSNTHKIRGNLKTKYNDNKKDEKKQRSVFGMYTKVDVTQRFSEGSDLSLLGRIVDSDIDETTCCATGVYSM